MHQFLLAAAVLLFAAFGESPKQIQSQCLAANTLRDTLSRDVPGIELRDLRGVDAALALQAINAMPPKTTVDADHLILASVSSAPMVVVLFFKDGCMLGRAVLPKSLVERMVLAIQRGGA